MSQTFVTRADEGIGEGAFDSIAWVFETHIKEPDDKDVDSAILYGNEDAPERIELYSLASPTITDTPIRVWTAPDPETHQLGCVCADCSGAELTTDND